MDTFVGHTCTERDGRLHLFSQLPPEFLAVLQSGMRTLAV